MSAEPTKASEIEAAIGEERVRGGRREGALQVAKESTPAVHARLLALYVVY